MQKIDLGVFAITLDVNLNVHTTQNGQQIVRQAASSPNTTTVKRPYHRKGKHGKRFTEEMRNTLIELGKQDGATLDAGPFLAFAETKKKLAARLYNYANNLRVIRKESDGSLIIKNVS